MQNEIIEDMTLQLTEEINPSKRKCRPEFYEFNRKVQQNTNKFNTGKLLSMIHFHMLNNTFHITLEIILYIVLLHK